MQAANTHFGAGMGQNILAAGYFPFHFKLSK
jgi:hypothetical protein